MQVRLNSFIVTESLRIEPIRSVSWSPNGKKFVACSNDWSVSVTSLDTLQTDYLYAEICKMNFSSYPFSDALMKQRLALFCELGK